MKKLVALLLVIATLCGVLTACGVPETEDYMIKGEFYSELIKKFNYYPLNNTVEEMEEALDYKIEAQTMVDWNLLPEDIAFEKLENTITRQEAILACFNTIYIKKTGNIDDIKDAKMCDYPQEMADAVATGIVELKNGYIDGKEKLTYSECEELLEKTLDVKTNSHYAEDEGSVTYENDTYEITYDDLANEEVYIDGYEEADAYINGDGEDSESVDENNLEVSGVKEIQKPEITNLAVTDKNKPQIKNLDTEKATFSVTVGKPIYEQLFSKYKVGDVLVYTGFVKQELNANGLAIGGNVNSLLKPFAGKITEIVDWEARKVTPSKKIWKGSGPCITLILSAVTDLEKAQNTVISRTSRQIKTGNFKQLKSKFAGFKIEVKSVNSGSGLKVTLNKTLNLSENKYKNWRDWTAHPKMTVEAGIDNIWLTIDNSQNFYKKGGTASFKLTSDTYEKFTLETGGLRLAPDSNRNGKFWSNLSRSRFTDGMGAEEVKIARINFAIPNTPIKGELYLYLTVDLDGKVTLTLTQTGNGFEVAKNVNGKLVVNSLGKASTGLQAELNINAEIVAQLHLYITFITRAIVSGELAFGFNLFLMMSIFYTEDDKEELAMTGYGDPEEARYAQQEDDKLKTCADIAGNFYLRGGFLKDNLVADVAGQFDYDVSKWSFKIEPEWAAFAFHIEDGGTVPECTRGGAKATDDPTIEEDDAEHFGLETMKIHMPPMTCAMNYVVNSPISDNEIKNKKGLKVKSKNEKIAKVYVDQDTKAIMIEAVSPGSTEVEVFVKKNKKTGKEYCQTFSVTVLDDYTIEKTAYSVVPLPSSSIKEV